MTVSELSKILKTGDIIISRTVLSWNPISWLSFAIRMFAKTKYNHASLFVEKYECEAIGRGVTCNSVGARLHGKSIIVLRPINRINREVLIARAESVIGVSRYDFVGLIHQAIYLTTGKWIGKRDDSAARRMYCFEYVAWVYKHVFPMWFRITPAEVIDSKHFEVVTRARIE